ncbi:MAG: threonylcarbamoyl-AMP synthase, partial [Clostridiales Family XIII bacterium]|nr:threonylcarbamoyl-AMP synthase [Clostridiales Family XIII bacterium]
MKTKILDVSRLTEETLRQAQVFREPEAMDVVDDAMEKIKEAAAILRRGGLVAFPTETVYGLGANAFDEEAAARVYAAKGRPSDNPMIVHIARASDVGLLAKTLSPAVVKLADAFWPGPLTMVLEKRAEVPDRVTGGLSTVGVRLPDSPIAIELIRLARTPVAAPSANISGSPSPTKAAHVIADLDGKVAAILAGPDSQIGIESTVVDMTADPPQILRPGIVTKEDIEAAIGTPVEIDPALLARTAWQDGGAGAAKIRAGADAGSEARARARAEAGDAAVNAGTAAAPAPRAPGMKYRHYAPKAEMVVIEGAREKVRAEIVRLKALNEQIGRSVGVLFFEERAYLEAAHDFYASLRDMDESGADLIIAGALSETGGVGFALMNRLMKAAGYNIVRV